MVVPEPICLRTVWAIKYHRLDALEHQAVGTFHLPIALWVCHRSIADLDTELFAPVCKFRPGELSAIICDNPVRNTESNHNALEELFGLGSYDRGNRFGFNQLGELVDGNEEVV